MPKVEKNPIIPENVSRSFDKIVILLNDLAAEAVSIKEKFGDRSKLYQTKLAQIETIKLFYNTTKKFIEGQAEREKYLKAEVIGLQIHLTQELYSMTFRQAAEVLELNFSPEFVAAQDEIDKIIKILKDKKNG